MSENLECERKFLIDPTQLPEDAYKNATRIVQGYIASEAGKSTRVRMIIKPNATEEQLEKFYTAPLAEVLDDETLFSKAILCTKTPHSEATRVEVEEDISVVQGLELLATTRDILRKTRYTITHGGKVWEVDAYGFPLSPIVIAEVELDPSELNEELDYPNWHLREVTLNNDYSNESLAKFAADMDYPPR